MMARQRPRRAAAAPADPAAAEDDTITFRQFLAQMNAEHQQALVDFRQEFEQADNEK